MRIENKRAMGCLIDSSSFCLINSSDESAEVNLVITSLGAGSDHHEKETASEIKDQDGRCRMDRGDSWNERHKTDRGTGYVSTSPEKLTEHAGFPGADMACGRTSDASSVILG
jgi:hypothetical protein